MKKIIFAGLCIFLLVLTPVVHGQSQVLITTDHDGDNDGVCDQPREELSGNVGIATHNCEALPEGDKCLNTRAGSSVQRSGPYTGCADYELSRIINFWSVDLGEARPKRVKINWLTDQQNGVEVYQPIAFERNLNSEERVKFSGNPSFYCRDVGGTNAIDAIPTYYPSPNSDGQNGTMVLKLRRFGEGELNTRNIVSRDGNPSVVGDIRLNCVSSIRQCQEGDENDNKVLDIEFTEGGILKSADPNQLVSERGLVAIVKGVETKDYKFGQLTVGDILKAGSDNEIKDIFPRIIRGESNCQPLFPLETDEFDILIPIETLALQPPDKALEVGITVSDNLIKGIDKVLTVVEKARFWSGNICGFSIGFVLLGNLVGKWFDWIEELSEKWWFGTGGKPKGDEAVSGGLFGGKAFCRYYACPADLCPFLQKETGKEMYENSKGEIKELERYPEFSGEQIKRKFNEKYVDRMNRQGKHVQDSLVTSVACGCITGVEQNLYKTKVILESWNRCLNLAKNSDRYVAECEEWLSEQICTHVLGEFSELGKISVVGKFFGNLRESVAKLFNVDKESKIENIQKKSAKAEADTSKRDIPESESLLGDTKNFFDREIKGLTTSHARGNLGYETKGVSTAVCELALYQKIPQYDIIQSLRINELQLDTSLSASWNSQVAYATLPGQPPKYEYEVSWTVIAGSENYRYRLYLETADGKKKYLPLPSNGFLPEVGDLDSEYLQITDQEEYTKLCFDVPLELNPVQCFPPGKFSKGSPFDLSLFSEEDIDDKDGDRLPDWWEKKYNCYPGRAQADFVDEDDYKICKALIDSGGLNILSEDSKDSDGDGLGDERENPDGDVFNNYFEFSNGQNPNVAGGSAGGVGITGECRVESYGFILHGGNQIGTKKRYDLGERVILSSNHESSNPGDEEIVARVEITGPGVFFRESEVTLDQLKDGINLWTIPATEGPLTGVYTLKVNLVRPKDFFGYESCINTNKDPNYQGRVIESEKEFFVYNKELGGCSDSDNGKDVSVNGVCFDIGGNHVDGCGLEGKGVTEWFCNSNDRCESKIVGCANGFICPSPEGVGVGACVLACSETIDKENNLFVAGACQYLNNGKLEERKDKCEGPQSIKQYGCVNNKCEVVNKDGSLLTGALQSCPGGFSCLDGVNGAACLDEAKVAEARSAPDTGIINDLNFLDLSPLQQNFDDTVNNLGKDGLKEKITTEAFTHVPSVNTDLVLGLITQESQGKVDADSGSALGIMQLNPTNPEYLQYDRDQLLNPDLNIRLGVDLLSKHLVKYKNNEKMALAEYNMGIVRLNKLSECAGKSFNGWEDIVANAKTIQNPNGRLLIATNPDVNEKCHLPKQTVEYVSKVLGYKKMWEDKHASIP
jgi:hypothetical protein